MTAPQHPGESRALGLQIPASPFAHDDGSVPSELKAALVDFAAGTGQARAVMTALARCRLLVPIVAVADSTQTNSSGQEVDKDSHLATVLVRGPNDEKAMLAFSSGEAMARWRADARPAPVSGVGAAQAALAEGAATLLVDLAGPTPLAITAGDLRALAGAIDIDTARGLLSELVEEIPGLAEAQLAVTDETPDLVVAVDPSLSDAEYRELLATLSKRLRDHQKLAQIFAGGLRIQVVASGQMPIDTPGVLPGTIGCRDQDGRMKRKLAAEFIGTFALVFLAVGAAVTGLRDLGGVGVALGFGLVLTFLVFAIGSMSGAHVNPAVTLAMMLGRKMPVSDGLSYMGVQVLGAIGGAFLLWVLVQEGVEDQTGAGIGANAYGPTTGGALGAFILETTLTALFVFVILMVTEKGIPPVGTGLAIGAALTAVHLVGVPLTGTSVNPARSIGPALFSGTEALQQLWLFILAPLLGGVIAVGVWKVARNDTADAKA